MALSHVALPFILFDVSFNFMQAADAQDTAPAEQQALLYETMDFRRREKAFVGHM